MDNLSILCEGYKEMRILQSVQGTALGMQVMMVAENGTCNVQYHKCTGTVRGIPHPNRLNIHIKSGDHTGRNVDFDVSSGLWHYVIIPKDWDK